jgi:hypothetical protein
MIAGHFEFDIPLKVHAFTPEDLLQLATGNSRIAAVRENAVYLPAAFERNLAKVLRKKSWEFTYVNGRTNHKRPIRADIRNIIALDSLEQIKRFILQISSNGFCHQLRIAGCTEIQNHVRSPPPALHTRSQLRILRSAAQIRLFPNHPSTMGSLAHSISSSDSR